MRSRQISWLVAVGCGGLLIGALDTAVWTQGAAVRGDVSAASPAADVLIGTVRDAKGGPLGGVAVSARAVGKTITTSVFTDERGRFVFPRLDSGQFNVWAQAVGYETARAEVRVGSSQQRAHDFTLTSLEDFTAQLSGAEWMAALPEDTQARRRMKQIFQHTCTGCHVPHLVLQNRLDAAGWRAVITAMEHVSPTLTFRKESNPLVKYYKEELVEYLAEMRGPGSSPMKFKLLPRPTGEAARVVITEYDVPPAETPDALAPHNGSEWSEGTPGGFLAIGIHDLAPDFDGNVWINDSVPNKTRTYAKVDAKTGHVKTFKVPGGTAGHTRGSHGMTIGPDGIIWLNIFAGEPNDADGTSGVGSLGRLDPRTEKLDIFAPPKGMASVGGHIEIDGKGKVWTITNRGVLRFDPETRQFAEFKAPTVQSSEHAATYGIGADRDGNGWAAIITHDKLGVSDAKTGATIEISLPPRTETAELATPRDLDFYASYGGARAAGANLGFLGSQAPRRLGGDPSAPTMWVANWWGQNLAQVDIRSHKVAYHPTPIADSGVYDVDVDSNHVAWVSLRNTDRVAKYDPATRRWTVFMLPTLGVEARYIKVDRKTGNVWVPYWRTSKVGRLQFRSEREMQAAAALDR
jgi:streptogramin lyase